MLSDDVVEHFDLQKLPGADQIARHFYIRFARRRVPDDCIMCITDLCALHRRESSKQAGLVSMIKPVASHIYSFESHDKMSFSRCQEGPCFPFMGRSFSAD
jgi:hypothetical protein